MMTINNSSQLTQLSKEIVLALRHEPLKYGLQLDENDRVDLEDVVAAFHSNQWPRLTSQDVQMLVASARKKRHEISEGRIRALYGHSLPARIAQELSRPPARLFHGTSPTSARAVRDEGLKPMHRQYVHLSTDIETAKSVGGRKAADPVILTVAAAAAHEAGVAFYPGNDQTWLADALPARFITLLPP